MTSALLELSLAIGALTVFGALKLRSIYVRGSMHAADFLILMVCLYFGLGPPLSYAYGGLNLPEEHLGTLSVSYAIVCLYVAGLACGRALGLVRRPPPQRTPPQTGLDAVDGAVGNVAWTTIVWVYLTVVAFRAYVAWRYGILFSGTATSERMAALSYTVVVVHALVSVAALATVLWCCVQIWRTPSGWQICFCIVTLLVEVAWTLMRGRRWLLELFLFLVIGFYLRRRQFKWWPAAIWAAVALLLVTVMFPLFFRLRESYQVEAPTGSAFDDLSYAVRGLDTGGLPLTSDDTYSANAAARPLIIRFVCRIVDAQEYTEVMWGRALLSTINWAIPAALNPGKARAMPSEQTIVQHYGLPAVDQAMSWPALGAADFGWMGGFIVGVLSGLVLTWWERATLRYSRGYPIWVFLSVGAMLDFCVFVEADPSALWTSIRSVVILFFVVAGARLMTRGRPRTASGQGSRGRAVAWLFRDHSDPASRGREDPGEDAASGVARLDHVPRPQSLSQDAPRDVTNS